MNKERSSGISAVIGIVILTLLVLVLSAGVLFAAQTLVGDQPNQMVGGMTEERISPYEQRVSLVSQGNADDLTVVSPLGTEYNLSQVGDSQLYLAVSPSVSGAQDPQILGVKNGERQVLTTSEIQDGIPADIIVDKHGTGDYMSIRNALNAAQTGDIVVVEKATYNENIDVPKNVSLIAEHGTIIQDQNPAEPVISINNGNATIMNFIINADPVKGDNHYASHGILVKGRNTEVIGNTIRNATSPAGDSAGLRVEGEGVVARYNNFRNNKFSLSVATGVGSVQLCSNQLDGGLHGSFSKSTYETFVMRNYWNKGVPSTVLNNVLSDRPNVTATDVSRNAVNFNKIFETSNNREILAAKAFPGTRLFGGAPCGIQLSFTNQGSSVNVVNASISYEIKNVTYNVTFNEDNTATLTRGNNSTTTSYSVSGGDTSWDTGESLSLSSPDSGSSGSSGTSGVWSSGGGGGGASFWGGGTGGGLSGGSLFGSGGGASLWGVSSGTTSSDVKVTKSPTETNASVEQSPPENVTETEKENVTVDLGADFKATVGDEISLDAVVTGGTSPYNYTWTLGDGTTSYSKSVTHIYDSTGNYTISLNVTDSNSQSDTDSITVWIQESTTTTKTKNETLTLNEQVSNLSPGETLVIPSGSYSSVNVDVPGVTLVGDGSVVIDGLSITADNVKVKSVEVNGPLSITGSDYSMYDSTIDNTGSAWVIEVYETGAYFDGVTGEANNGMYIARALQDIQFTSGSLTANSGQGVLVKKHTGIVGITDSSVTATGAGIYREHGSQLYLARNSISGSPDVKRVLNEPPQPAFTYNDAPLDTGGYGVKFDPSPTTDPEEEPITSMKWDFNNDGAWDAYGDGVKQYEYPSYGTYNVTLSVTDYHGVTVNYEREIAINEYYFAVSTDKSTVNTSEPVEFNATTSVPDSNIDHYNMDYDGDGTAEEQVTSLPVTHAYTTAGNFTSKVELVTTNSGTLINTTSVSVLAPPEPVIVMNLSNPIVGDSIRFNASESVDPDGGDLTYSWDFGDGTSSSQEVSTHTYSSAGTYTVTLTVTDDEGVSASSSETAIVDDPISTTVIDNFEGNNLDSYSGNLGYYSTQSSVVREGNYALHGDSNNENLYSHVGDGLNYYPKRGDTFEYYIRLGDSSDGGQVLFGYQDNNNQYRVRHENNGNEFSLRLGSSGQYTSIDSTSVDWKTDTWYRVVVKWHTPTIEVVLYNASGDKVSTLSASDTTFDSGGVGFSTAASYCCDGVNVYWDDVHKLESSLSPSFTYSPYLPTSAETVSFDASASSGGSETIEAYKWDFDGDGTIDATGETASHSFDSAGNYTVSLILEGDLTEKTLKKNISVGAPAPTTQLVSYYDFESGSGSTLVDRTSDNDGTIYGGPQWITRKDGAALQFDGSDDWVDMGAPNDLMGWSLSKDMTISAWVNPESSGVIAGQAESGADNMYSIAYGDADGDGAMEFRGYIDDVTGGFNTLYSRDISTSSGWHLVTMTYDGSEVELFVDGQKESSVSSSNSITDDWGGTANFVVARTKGSSSYLKGSIDEVRVYDRDLSSEEVGTLYDTTKGNSPPTAEFSYQPKNPIPGDSIQFNASSSVDSDGVIVSYEWDFNNDGTTDATGKTVTHTFSSEGDYQVSLTTSDDAGKQSTTTKTISVLESNEILSWSSAGDWDNAASENGVVHESVSNTDHMDNSVVKMGYDIDNPFASNSLEGYWPLHEDNSSTAYDYSGNNNDGTLSSGVSQNKTGLLGTSAYQFSGNEYVQTGTSGFTSQDFTLSYWFKRNTDGYIGGYGGPDQGSKVYVSVSGSSIYLETWGSTNPSAWNVNIDKGWHHVAVTDASSSSYRVYFDGQDLGAHSQSNSISIMTQDSYIGRHRDSSRAMFDGKISESRVYSRHLSHSEIQSMYEVVNGPSSIEPQVKSFSSPKKPGLTNLSYTLNGQSINITVVGSPGAASQEKHTVSLDGRNTYNISWNNAHKAFKVNITLETDNPEVTPSVNRVQLKELTSVQKVVDDFEDGDLKEYIVNDGSITSDAYSGTKALKLTNAGGDDYVQSTTGLETYPQAGDNTTLFFKYNNDGDTAVSVSYGASGDRVDGTFEAYRVRYHSNYNTLELIRHDGGTSTTLNSTSMNLNGGTWYKMKINWQSSGEMTVQFFEPTGANIKQISATDTTYTSGGIRFGVGAWSGNGNQNAWIDNITVTRPS